jgi:hypothetical protein
VPRLSCRDALAICLSVCLQFAGEHDGDGRASKKGGGQTYHGSVNDGVTPPLRRQGAGHGDGEEDQDGAEGETGVEAGGEDVVVLQPPAAEAGADVLVEDEADHAPSEQKCQKICGVRWQRGYIPEEVVHGHCGWDVSGAAEDDGGVEEAHWTAGESACEEVECDWEEGSEEPEPLEASIGAVRGKHLRAKESVLTYRGELITQAIRGSTYSLRSNYATLCQ